MDSAPVPEGDDALTESTKRQGKKEKKRKRKSRSSEDTNVDDVLPAKSDVEASSVKKVKKNKRRREQEEGDESLNAKDVDETLKADGSMPDLVSSKKAKEKRAKRDDDDLTEADAAHANKNGVDHQDESRAESGDRKRSKKKKKAHPATEPKHPREYNWSDMEDEEDQTEQIEGFVYEGILLLRDVHSNAIFSSERDDRGELVRVGEWRADGQHEFTSYEWKLPSITKTEHEPHKFKVTDSADHCETGPKAYADIKPTLEVFAELIPGVERPSNLRIWDPFYCTGRMKSHMLSLGFPKVHNENEDFYVVKQHPPRHDIIMTNPPYSRDHIPRLLEYCLTVTSPCLLLLPSWVCKKDYFARFDDANSRYFFLVPRSGRYTYHNPGLDGAKVGRTAPFQSFWYIAAKGYRSELLRRLTVIANNDDTNWELYKSINRIPERFFEAEDGW